MGFFDNRFRYLLVFICFLCLTAIAANYIIIHFTFICMSEDMSDAIPNENGTLVSRYDYSSKQKGIIIGAVAVGTAVGTPPINYLYIKYGAKWTFFVAGCFSVFSTALVPLAAHAGLPYLVVLRFIQGLAFAADFATIGMMCVRWAPLKQTGFYIAALTSFSSVSASVTNPLTGALCTSFLGWRSSFYFHAGFGAIVFLLWPFLYHDDPELHPSVSQHELRVIQKGKTKAHIERSSFVPYLNIILNPIILIVWANAFAEMTSLTLLLAYSPTYFHKVLGYSVNSTGILVAVSAALHIPVRVGFGIISDYITCLSERTKMVLYNGVAVGLAGVLCGSIGFVRANNADISVTLFTSVYFCMSLNPGGFYKCATFVSRQYAHFVLATIQFMKCVALFVAPAIVAHFVVDEKNFDEWKWVFFLNGGLLLFTNAMFCVVATDKPAAFTEITEENKSESAMEAR